VIHVDRCADDTTNRYTEVSRQGGHDA